jgi:hypothetical protein
LPKKRAVNKHENPYVLPDCSVDWQRAVVSQYPAEPMLKRLRFERIEMATNHHLERGMAAFDIITDKDQALTSIVFTGTVSPADVFDALTTFYESEITPKVLWNFSHCDINALITGNISAFIDAAKSYAHLRIEGKSALVGSDDLAVGLGRMFSSLAEIKGHPISHEIFRSVDDARAWLNA